MINNKIALKNNFFNMFFFCFISYLLLTNATIDDCNTEENFLGDEHILEKGTFFKWNFVDFENNYCFFNEKIKLLCQEYRKYDIAYKEKIGKCIDDPEFLYNMNDYIILLMQLY